MHVRRNWFSENQPKGIFFFLVLVLIAGAFSSVLAAPPWWNSAWGYRVRLDVDANGYARFEKPVERALNFTSLFSAVGTSGTLNENSIRVIEVNGSGIVVDSTVVFQFDRDTDYNATTKASGVIVIVMKGTTSSSAVRHYDVYFDNLSGFSAPSYTDQVSISTVSDWEGQASFRVVSTRATYYYHKLGGGFASAIDANGHDWISYHPPTTGFLGEYRGIPNMGRCAHPGYTNSSSTVVSQGPVKITILSQTNDSRQKWYTAVYPHHVTITVARSDSNYWFLYEGTPAGALNGSTQFMYKATGEKSFLNTEFSADLPGDEWVYFSDPGANRSLYMIHHEQDDLPESYWNGGGDGMTVFGFGRDGNESSPTKWFLTAAPQTLSFGIMDGTAFSASSDTIRSVFKAVSISQGSPEKRLPPVPAATALISPADHATDIPLALTPVWRATPEAISYHLQVSVDAGFASGLAVDDASITDTTHAVSGLVKGTKYYWRVSGVGVSGEGPFSTTRDFTTYLSPPGLIYPGENSVAVPLSLSFRWNSVPGAVRYLFQLGPDSNFVSLTMNDTTITDTTRSVAGLANSTRYYWRLGVKTASATSTFSPRWTFRSVIPVPETVVLVGPGNLAQVGPDSIRLLWRRTSIPSSKYWVEVAPDAGFTAPIFAGEVPDTLKVFRGLQLDLDHWWRVRGGNGEAWGSFSEVRTFTPRTNGTSVEEGGTVPHEYALEQNYPNPFNPSTIIRYGLPNRSHVTLTVFNTLGQQIAVLRNGEQEAGYHEVKFDASGFSSGVYFYRIKAGDFVQTKRLLLQR